MLLVLPHMGLLVLGALVPAPVGVLQSVDPLIGTGGNGFGVGGTSGCGMYTITLQACGRRTGSSPQTQTLLTLSVDIHQR